MIADPTITVNGGNAQTPAEMAVTRAVVQRTGVGLETLQLTQEGTGTLSYGDVVVVQHGGNTLFIGKVKEARLVGSGNYRGVSYVAKNAWAELERLVYHQTFGKISDSSGGTTAYNTARCILHQDDAGNHITTAAQIADLIGYGATHVAGLAAGSITIPSIYLPMSEARDQTVAQLLQQVMSSGTPDSAIHWSYDADAGESTIAVTNFASLSEVSGSEPLRYDLMQVHEQAPDSVKIDKLISIAFNGREHFGHESSLSGLNSEGVGVEVHTFDLAGATNTFSATGAKQKIVTMPLPQEGYELSDGAGGSNAKRTKIFEMLKFVFPDPLDHPDLGVTLAADTHFAFQNLKLWMADPTTDDAQDGANDFRAAGKKDWENPNRVLQPAADPDDDPESVDIGLPRILVSGQLQDWMPDYLEAAPVNFSVDVYARNVPDMVVKWLDSIGSVQFQGEGAAAEYPSARVSGTVIATNARTKTYRALEAVDVDAGFLDTLAGDFAGQWGGVEWRGNAVFAGFHAGFTPGKKFALSGVSTAAMVQGTQFDLIGLETTVEVGPPDRLGVQDQIERQRLQLRAPSSWKRSEERTKGLLAGGGSAGAAAGGTHQPLVQAHKVTGPETGYPFEPYFLTVGGSQLLYIRPGWVRPGAADVMPTLGGTALDNATPPSAAGKETGTVAVWLMITATPNTEAYYDTAADDTLYRLAPGIEISTVTVEFTTGAGTRPAGEQGATINTSTGAVTQDAIFAVLVNVISNGVPQPRTLASINRHFYIKFCPDNDYIVHLQ